MRFVTAVRSFTVGACLILSVRELARFQDPSSEGSWWAVAILLAVAFSEGLKIAGGLRHRLLEAREKARDQEEALRPPEGWRDQC